MSTTRRLALLSPVPFGLAASLVPGLPAPLVFVLGALAIASLANLIREATEQLASRVGTAIGGLLNVTLGSVAEFVLALFILLRGEVDIVRAQMIGSILGTTLLGLGLAMMAGGATRVRQRIRLERAGLLGGLLVLVVIALVLPAVFDLSVRIRDPGDAARLVATDEDLSLGVAAVLLALYAGNLVFTLITHRDVFAARPGGDELAEASPWPLWRTLAALAVATVLASLLAESVSGALSSSASSLGLAPVFLGLVPLALVGTVADLFAAVSFARADRIGLAADICVGSAVQVSLVILPLLAVLSFVLGHPMSLVFSDPLDLFAIVAAALAVNVVAVDGETNWFEGLLLVGIYVLLAIAFFFVGA